MDYQIGMLESFEFIKRWETAREASVFLNINPSHIAECCKSKRKSSGGYKWEYEWGCLSSAYL